MDIAANSDQLRSCLLYTSLFILCAIIHTFLVFMLPLMAVSATHGRRFDVVSLRVFSIAELLLALFTCFFYYEFAQNMMLVGVESVYFQMCIRDSCFWYTGRKRDKRRPEGRRSGQGGTALCQR